MKKNISMLVILFMISTAAIAEEQNNTTKDEVKIIPVVQYDYLSLDSQSIQSPGTGLILQSDDVMFVGVYTRHTFGEELSYDYPDVYHTIDTLLDGKIERHQYLGIFKSESDLPVAGGLHTFQAAAVYGYEVIAGGQLSLVLGGGLAVSDFGIERSNGEPWPVIPVPLVRMNYSAEWIKAKFECITSPNLSFTLAPESRLRLSGDLRMDQTRDMRDLIFDVALAYRFFKPGHEMGDFAGVSAGFKNDNYGAFCLKGKDGEESIEVHYYSVYGTLDLSLLKITCGYAFNGRELYREEYKVDAGSGYYVSVQGLYQF